MLPAVEYDNTLAVIIASVLMSVINTFIKPFIKIIALPINVLTIGISSFFVNGLLVFMVFYFTPGLTIASYWWCIAFAFLLSLISFPFGGYK